MNGNPTNGKGAARIMWWIIGPITAPVILAGTASLCHIVIDTSDRLNALERDTEHRLHQIEKKLDRLVIDNGPFHYIPGGAGRLQAWTEPLFGRLRQHGLAHHDEGRHHFGFTRGHDVYEGEAVAWAVGGAGCAMLMPGS